MTSTVTTVACPECRRENELERVYCHGCGARLDRTAIKARQEDIQDTRKRVKELFDPQRVRMKALFFKFGKLVLAACLVAAGVQIALPPDVPVSPKMDLSASQHRFALEKAVTRHQPAQIVYTEEQLNGYLVSALKVKQKDLDHPLIDFKRVVVALNEGSCSVTAERSLFGYSVFTTRKLTAGVSEGKLVVTTQGGSIGRLPVHPLIARFMGILFADVSNALGQESKLIAKMRSIEFHDKTLVLTAAP